MSRMIPKIIHYCWFGGKELPELAIKCIDSWRKFFPEYEIKEWNETNFDVYSIPYTTEAYKAQKYAFVSDYARFFILYKYGGLYFDTDVEVIKPMDDIIAHGSFMGCEYDYGSNNGAIAVAPGLGLGAEPGLIIYKKILELYDRLHFFNNDGSYNQKTVVDHTTDLLFEYGLKNRSGVQQIESITIYPSEYFCPMDPDTGELNVTANTRSIHHYMASWITSSQLLYRKIEKIFGFRFAQFLSHNLKRLGLFK